MHPRVASALNDLAIVAFGREDLVAAYEAMGEPEEAAKYRNEAAEERASR